MRQAATRVAEPMHRFRLEVPGDVLGAVLPVLVGLAAVPRQTTAQGAAYVVVGDIPAGRVHALEQRLPAVTRGEGMLESAFDHHRPVRGPVPVRDRSDHDPTDRRRYLLAVVRRVAGRRDGS